MIAALFKNNLKFNLEQKKRKKKTNETRIFLLLSRIFSLQ